MVVRGAAGHLHRARRRGTYAVGARRDVRRARQLRVSDHSASARGQPRRNGCRFYGADRERGELPAAKGHFRDEKDYIEAFEELRTQWGNFTLADFGLIFDRLRRGDLADLRFRFLLPELMKACEAYADTKCDRVEEREKLMKRYRNTDHYNDWNALTEMMGGAEAKRTTDRVKWMQGEDVTSWADKAKLAARDSARRNGEDQ
jgi:hypothetical protein